MRKSMFSRLEKPVPGHDTIITIREVHECYDGNYSGNTTVDELLVSTKMNRRVTRSTTLSSSTGSTSIDSNPTEDETLVASQRLPNLNYSPIDSGVGEIRLLQIKKATSQSNIVQCEIVHANLDNPPDFHTLSYCCGTDEATAVVICNSSRHHVYPSLNAALKAYRDSPLVSKPLWADRISINQSDKEELGQQILLTRRIYSRASQVFIHLGDFDKKWPQGFDLMNRLNQAYEHNRKYHDNANLDELRERYQLPPPYHVSWKLYQQIFKRPWFRRTWILQEIALSRRALVGFGHFFAGWEILINSLRFLQDNGFDQQVDFGLDISHNAVTLHRILEICEAVRKPDQSSLINFLSMTQEFQVSDPRDKVIAILGLIRVLDAELASLADYRLSANQIFHQASVYLIEKDLSIPMLARAGSQRQAPESELPSWSVDWMHISRYINERPLTLLRKEPFYAGGVYARPKISLSGTNNTELIITGLTEHTITSLSDEYPMSEEENTSFNTHTPAFLLQWYESAVKCLQKAHQSQKLAYTDIEDAFCRTMLIDSLNTDTENHSSTSEATPPEEIFAQAINELTREAELPPTESHRRTSFSPTDSTQSLITQLSATARGRRFGITNSGHMCLVPSKTELGDTLAFFVGMPTPFVLRQTTSTHQTTSMDEAPRPRVVVGRLVGDAYAHGLMLGQAFLQDQAFRRIAPVVLL